MDRERLLDLLCACEARIVDNLRSTNEVLQSLRAAREALSATEAGPQGDAIVHQLLTTIEAAHAEPAARGDFRMLIFRPQDESYSIGRRRIALTETEANILHIFRQVMPGPVSREMILSRLYDAQTRPGAGAIDVFVSKLRQKLSLASEGREYIESIRGKGWALRPELCRIDAA